MRKIINLSVLLCLAITLVSWGTFGHEHINRSAVFALPAPLQSFFYNHIDFITQESTVPDLRKYTLNDKAENPRHFIDLENFGAIDSLPTTLEEVKKKYDEKFLQSNGILPWYIEEMMAKLTKAFKEKNKTEILFIAADLGHYIGDANMPLHTSANYDGQLTNQKGVHALWESRLPELFGESYNYKVNEAKYITDIHKEVWRIIMRSHQLVDSVLMIDQTLRTKNTEAIMYTQDASGKSMKNKYGALIFSDGYAKQFHVALNGMVERQMENSIEATANLWFTAWVNAGKPDLSSLDSPDLTKLNRKQLSTEVKLWQEGKLFGMESQKEF